jgi:Zn-dependent peptidase ImmA (M78 family)
MNPVTVLRDLVPIRPLTRSEAMRIAELQAQKLLAISGLTGPPVPTEIITDLPRIRVEYVQPFPVSGASHWNRGIWLVALRASEPLVRQRFSLAHEFKHILDNRFIDVIYNGIPEAGRHQAIEQICDYFAGCLLVPRPWLKRAWGSGLQTLPKLAQHFGVSESAIEVRLNQVGLIEPTARCDNRISDWYVRSLRAKVDRAFYTRELSGSWTADSNTRRVV